MRKALLALLVVVGALTLAAGLLELQLFLETDRCLDDGGRWDRQHGECAFNEIASH